jgi:hypothetical protein
MVPTRIAIITPPSAEYPSDAGSPRNLGGLVPFFCERFVGANVIGTEAAAPWTSTIPEV